MCRAIQQLYGTISRPSITVQQPYETFVQGGIAMSRRTHDVQVSPRGDGRSGWKVTQDHRVLSEHRKQSAAILAGIKEARKDAVDLTVRNRTGQVRSKDSYGHDPRSIRDTEH